MQLREEKHPLHIMTNIPKKQNFDHEVQELITKKEVARRLHVTERSVDNYTNKGIIKRLKLGANSRYDWHDVLTSIKNQ